MTNQRLKKEILDGMKALEKIGVISGATMRDIKVELLGKPPRYTASAIKSIRQNFGISQAVFAALLNVSATTIQNWEQGKKIPSAPAFKLLEVVKKNGLEVLL